LEKYSIAEKAPQQKDDWDKGNSQQGGKEMELQDIHSMEIKLEDALIELKISEPQREELKKEVKSLKSMIKSTLKWIRRIESRIDGFGAEGEILNHLNIDQVEYLADALEDVAKSCLRKYEEIGKLLEEEERLYDLKDR